MSKRGVYSWQWTIGQVMTAIAVCAVGLAAPMLFLLAAGAVFWWHLILGVIDTRTVRRAAELSLLAILFLAVCAMFL